MIVERVNSGLARAKAKGVKLGRGNKKDGERHHPRILCRVKIGGVEHPNHHVRRMRPVTTQLRCGCGHALT
jgi:hypothetical protein